MAFILGLIASAGAAGCFLSEEETEESGGRITNGSVADALKSTLVLENGCMATKVGPRHLLTAARCVADKPAFAAGKKIKFKVASTLGTLTEPEEAAEEANEPAEEEIEEETGDAGASSDAGRAPAPRQGDAGRAGDAAAEDDATETSGTRGSKEVKIKKIEINASFTSKCSEEGSCAFKSLEASDAKDIAVIVLDADLTSIPTVPIDLDAVGQTDKLLVVGSNCSTFAGDPTGVKTFKTVAVPARALNHLGSPYRAEPQLTTRLNGAYVVTPGIGWREDEPKVCKNDIGAPVFRGAKLAVAGVFSNYSVYEGKDIPVTLHHTKVDTTSKVGTWLKTLGVETLKSCSEAEGGCKKKNYTGDLPEGAASTTGNGETEPGDGGTVIEEGDGGTVEGDGGTETVPEPTGQGAETPLPGSSDDSYNSSSSDDGEEEEYDAGTKKKKKAAGGCSAAPGSMPSGGDGMVLGLGLAIAGVIARRRRAS